MPETLSSVEHRLSALQSESNFFANPLNIPPSDLSGLNL